jgi:hypothetical protein
LVRALDASARAAARPRPTDGELLRRYEPILRLTRGEEFLPTDVQWYLDQCSLWVCHADGRRELLVEEGQVTPEVLARPRPAERGAVHYLVFSDPLNLAELTAFVVQEEVARLRDPEHAFRPSVGRLARVGYVSRLLDALFSFTLLLRGRVPGDTAAAAALIYRARREATTQYPYYGRVVREQGWIALQYWFFYPFNNWRSSFFGTNDHEADWEMICVYLYERPDGDPAPAWVAYASHDYHGDDLRRAWDDAEEVERVGDHPVVYVGAGSHAAYFRPGEYLTEIEVPYLARLSALVNSISGFWQRLLRLGGEPTRNQGHLLRVAFVDYARGDGVAIGPTQERAWAPVVLEPTPEWVSQYRGLWGYYARDPAAGENAPSGPMYNRDGTVRAAWYDPVGWAGLDKVPPPPRELAVLGAHVADLETRQQELESRITAQTEALRACGVELAALRGNAHLTARQDAVRQRVAAVSAELDDLRKDAAQTAMVLEVLARRQVHLEDPAAPDAAALDERRVHIRRRTQPATAAELRWSRGAELWAATSIGLLLVSLVLLLATAREYLAGGLLALLSSFFFIDALFRQRLTQLIRTVTNILALASAAVLVYEFFGHLVVLLVVAAGVYLLWDNLRELHR